MRIVRLKGCGYLIYAGEDEMQILREALRHGVSILQEQASEGASALTKSHHAMLGRRQWVGLSYGDSPVTDDWTKPDADADGRG